MKTILALFVLFASMIAHAESASQTLSCKDNKIATTIESYDDGTVKWTVTRLKTGRSEEFMGYISSDDNGTEFYSTDQGSDLTFTKKSAIVSLEGNGPDETHNLVCE